MPGILILTTSHGASHRRASLALKQGLLALKPGLRVEVIDAVAHCSRWFRAYYDSYVIPLRYWPSLWRWIESRQHQSESTSPGWLFRFGGRPLFRAIEAFAPDAVVASEVGVCELAALHKRITGSRYFLAGLELMDFNRAWIQPEVDLLAVVHPDLGAELAAAGAPRSKIAECGMPIDPAYSALASQSEARVRLGLDLNIPLLLVLFGGTGFGDPQRILQALRAVTTPFQAVWIAGRNARLEAKLRRLTREDSVRPESPPPRVFGWVDNMPDWMTAADLLLSKPGGGTLMEAAACGLPLLAFDPLPGNEERACRWLEKWRAGLWVKSPDDLAARLGELLADPAGRAELRSRAAALARPRAALDTAEAILMRARLL